MSDTGAPRGAGADDGNLERERVMDAAEELFLCHGFSGVSMDMVASRLGMSKKTLYQHFRSKDSLERATVDRFFSRAQQEMRTVLAGAQTIRERLAGFLSVLASHLSRVNLPAIEHLEFRNPALWKHVNGGREHLIRTQVGTMIEEAQASGELRRDLSAEFMVGVFVTLVLTMATPSRLLHYSGGQAGFAADLLSLLLDGMTGPASVDHTEEDYHHER